MKAAIESMSRAMASDCPQVVLCDSRQLLAFHQASKEAATVPAWPVLPAANCSRRWMGVRVATSTRGKGRLRRESGGNWKRSIADSASIFTPLLYARQGNLSGIQSAGKSAFLFTPP